ncbi:MAG: arginine repressor [Thermoanaerobacteraceae bacterium]|uniref:arginine repressor n=1 Tax=Thermanaeromonas sp. C210 TaxID=2731925 RepID=UPI00155C09FB|nr:arginine repressor [Thermanaeromonas sp. C210]MBE3582081.1 arginine repressor [Thermoanaerobacteraceae bacterium]GFN23334.1 arginine repressor [Thermanaeromonas sp. C210]
MKKAERQQLILSIIGEKPIETQGQLLQELRARGLEVTQATVSRDIKELGLIKVPAGQNSYRYAPPPEERRPNPYLRLQRLFQDSVAKVDFSENLILIRTLPGTAHAVASCIDQIEWPEIIGTVAGDDTILVIIKPKDAVPAIFQRFITMLS